MADIIVNTDLLKDYAAKLGRINNRIITLDWQIKSLYSQVGFFDLIPLIKADSLVNFNFRVLGSQQYLNTTASLFEHAENSIVRRKDFNYSLFDLFDQMMNWRIEGIGTGGWHRFPKMRDAGFVTSVLESYYMISASDLAAFFKGEDEFTFYDKDGWKKTISFKPEAGYEDKNKILETKQKEKTLYQKNEDESFYDERGTILEYNFERKKEKSNWSAGLSGETEYAEGSIEAKALNREAHFETSGGFYVYEKDKDGNVKKIFSPGVSAEVGVSASVFEASAEGRLGSDLFGAYGEVNAEVISGEVTGKIALNRKEIYAGVSAEVNAVKVTGEVGGTVLGTDVGVTGSFKIGVGAHAKAGYTDGKLKVDVGLAAGIGIDVGIEVDVSGTINAVADVAESAWNATSGFVSDMKDGLSSLASNFSLW